MFGYGRPVPFGVIPVRVLRPQFMGWVGFAAGWQDHMDWMGQDDYSLWHRWQEDIADMRLDRMQRRAMLIRMLSQERNFGSGRRVQEIADRMLGLENDLGADEYGHIINRTETTTTTSTQTTATNAQRAQVINLMVDLAKGSSDPDANPAQLQDTIARIQAGQLDNIVREQLRKMEAGQVVQSVPSPPAALQQQQVQYGSYQQTAPSYQQNVQSPQQQQPVYSPAPSQPQQAQYGYQQTAQNHQQNSQAPQQQQPVYLPAPAQQQPVYSPAPPQQPVYTPAPPQQHIYAPAPQPMQPQPQPIATYPPTPAPVPQQPQVQTGGGYTGQQTFTQTMTQHTTHSSTSGAYNGQGQVMSPGYQQPAPAPTYGHQHTMQQSPQGVQYQQPMQITAGQNTPSATYYNQQGQVAQPQTAYTGQMAPYIPNPQGYLPPTPAPQHLVPAGQPGGYAASPDYAQQAGAAQQQPYQHNQYGQTGSGYGQTDSYASQAMVPTSSAVKPHKEKKSKKSSSSKKDKKR